jgi:hypothetical protein
MKDETIVTDVSDEQGTQVEVEEEEEQPELSDREKMLQQIENRRNDTLVAEGVDIQGDNLPEEEAVIEEEEEIPVDAEPIEVKIEGEETHVTADEINEKLGTEGEITDKKVVEYQKQVTGDKRLKEASIQRQINEAKAADLATKEAELAVLRNTPVDQEPVEIKPETVEALTSAFLVEDTEEAGKILTELISNARGPGPAQEPAMTPADVEATALNAVATSDYNKDLKAGQAKVKEKYGHLLGDPSLEAAVNQKSQEIFDRDPTKGPGDILLEAAESVQQTILKISGQTQKTDAEEKLERKRGAAAHATPEAGSKSSTAKKPAAPQSNKAIVSDMVASRNDALAGRA